MEEQSQAQGGKELAMATAADQEHRWPQVALALLTAGCGSAMV